jgi:nucleoside-diphosphate-sugar epimerase
MKDNIQKKISAAIFGSNGYIGSHFSLLLKENQWDTINYDIQPTSELANYKKIDIANNEELKSVDFEVDYIFSSPV